MFRWLRGFRLPRPSGQGLRTAALFLGAPIFGGLLAWQLYELGPERVCKTSYDMAKFDTVSLLDAFKACIGLYAKSQEIRDHAIIGLLAILGIGYLLMMMRELRMQGEFEAGLGGVKGKFQQDDDQPQAKVVTTTTTEVPVAAPPHEGGEHGTG